MSSCTRLPAGVSYKWASGLGAHIATLVAMLLLILPEGASSARNQTSHIEMGSHRKARSHKASKQAHAGGDELVFKAASRAIHPKLVLALAVISTSNTGDIQLLPDKYSNTITAQEVFMAAAECNDGFLNMTQYMHAIESQKKLKAKSSGFVDFRDADLDSNDRVDLAEFLFAWTTATRFLAAERDGTGFLLPCDLEKVYGDAANTFMVFDAYPKDGKLSRAEFLHVMIAWAQFGLLARDSVPEKSSSQAGNKKVTAPVLTGLVMMFHTEHLSEPLTQETAQKDPAKEVKLDSEEAANMTALFPVFTRLPKDGEVTQRKLSTWVLLTDTDRDDLVDLYEFFKYAVSVTKPPASWQSHQEELREGTKARAVTELLKVGVSNKNDWDIIVGLILVDMLTDRDGIVTDDDAKEVDRFKQIFELLSEGREAGLEKDQYQQQCEVSPHGEFFPAFENVVKHNRMDFLEFLLASKTAEIFASQLKPREEPSLALQLLERAFGEEIAKELVEIVPGQNQLDPASLLEALRVWLQFVILDQDKDARVALADVRLLAGIQEETAENGIEKDPNKGISKELSMKMLPLFADSFGPLSDSGPQHILEENIKKWFEKLDADKNGYVTLPDMIRSVAGRKHAEKKPVTDEGHAEMKSVAGRERAETKPVADEGHADMKPVANEGHADMKGLKLGVAEMKKMVDEGKLSMRMAINLLLLDLVADGDGIVGLKQYLGLQNFQKGRENGNLQDPDLTENKHSKVNAGKVKVTSGELPHRIQEGLAKLDKNTNADIDESELMQILQDLLTDMDWLVQRLTDFLHVRSFEYVLQVIERALKAKLLMNRNDNFKKVLEEKIDQIIQYETRTIQVPIEMKKTLEHDVQTAVFDQKAEGQGSVDVANVVQRDLGNLEAEGQRSVDVANERNLGNLELAKNPEGKQEKLIKQLAEKLNEQVNNALSKASPTDVQMLKDSKKGGNDGNQETIQEELDKRKTHRTEETIQEELDKRKTHRTEVQSAITDVVNRLQHAQENRVAKEKLTNERPEVQTASSDNAPCS